MAGSIQTKNRSNDSKNVWVSKMFNTCNLRHSIKKLLGIQPYCGQLRQGAGHKQRLPQSENCRVVPTRLHQTLFWRWDSWEGWKPRGIEVHWNPSFCNLTVNIIKILESQLTGMSEKVQGFNMEFYIGEQIKFLHWNNLRKHHNHDRWYSGDVKSCLFAAHFDYSGCFPKFPTFVSSNF